MASDTDYEAKTITETIADKIFYQYKESANLNSYIKALTTCFQDLEDVFADIISLRMLDNATDTVLDVYGTIVDISRGTYSSTDVTFFGLDADDENNPIYHKGLGDLDDETVGGYFRSIDQATSEQYYLDDASFKKLIYGKIKSNYYSRGLEILLDVICTLLDITEIGQVQVSENFDTDTDPYVQITFNYALSAKEQALVSKLDALPKPAGIRFEYSDTNGDF